MNEKLHKKLEDRREKGTLRSLSSFEGMIDFASNDYLGLSKVDIPQTKLIEQGATGSRLISGNSKYMEAAEQELANFFQSEASLCFNSGYDANIGIFSSIPQRGDVVLYDEFVHASARDGIRLSNAQSFGFKHNDTEDLERLLELKKDHSIYIAVESVYSMHGDFCPLLAIIQLADKYGADVILDEAHSAGIFGQLGKGFAHALGLQSKCLIRLVTFGKAYGTHGAVVLTSQSMRDYLINFARSFIYTTALPVTTFESIVSRVKNDTNQNRRMELMKNITYFRSKLPTERLISASNSPIQFIHTGDVFLAKNLQEKALKKNVFTKAIASPTVPIGSEGVRISLHNFNSIEEIDTLVKILSV